jgi:hypothetical protein
MRLFAGLTSVAIAAVIGACGSGGGGSSAGNPSARDGCALLADADLQGLLPDGAFTSSSTDDPFALFDDCSWIVGDGSNALFLSVRGPDAALFQNQTLGSYDDFSTSSATIRVEVATQPSAGTIGGDLWALSDSYLVNLQLQGSSLERSTMESRLVEAARAVLQRVGS